MSGEFVPTIRVLPTPDALAAAAAEHIVDLAHRILQEGREFTLALSGGSTPQTLFRLLASDAWANRINWQRVRVFFADERCVPPAHQDSNFGAACRLLLDDVGIPYQNIHRMAGESSPQAAADDYDRLLTQLAPDGLDLALLGIGEDGHTASLFPHTEALSAKDRNCVANYVPRLDQWRLTLTADYISLAGDVVVLAAGRSKSRILNRVLEGPHVPQELPAQLIRPFSGRMIWLLDAGAAGMFDEDED